MLIMSEAIASVPPQDDHSTNPSVRVPVGFNDLERLALQYKSENPGLSDEDAKNQALQKMLMDARNGTPSVTDHANANARHPSESSYRGGMHPSAQQPQQPTMLIRTNNANSAGQRISHAPSPSKSINPTRQLGYSPYPTVNHRQPAPKAPLWNQSQFPQNLGTMEFPFSTFPSSQRPAYTPRMSAPRPAAMLAGGSTFPTSDTRSYGVVTSRPKPNDLRSQHSNVIQGIPRRINTTIRDSKSESIENWINTEIPTEHEKPELPPSPPHSTSTERERSLIDLTVSGNETANSSPQNLASAQSPTRPAPTQATEPQDPTQKPKRRRQRPRDPVKCEFENCDRSFSSPHELRRHHKREHDNEKWVIIDITPDRRLKGCKRCDNGHIYGAKYNATAHLKRKHVNLRKRKEGQLELDCPHPDRNPKEFTQYANQFVQAKKAAYSESESGDGNVSDCVETFAAQMQSQSNIPVQNRPSVSDYGTDFALQEPMQAYYANATTPYGSVQQATYIGNNFYEQFQRKQERGELVEQYNSGSGSIAMPPNGDIFGAFNMATNQALSLMPTTMPDFNQSVNLDGPSAMSNVGNESDANYFAAMIDNFSNGTGMLHDIDIIQMSNDTNFLEGFFT